MAAPVGLDAPIPAWVGMAWPLLLVAGQQLFNAGRLSTQREYFVKAIDEMDATLTLIDKARENTEARVDRIDLRLTATETNVTNQGRILDRIEGKLDRLIEGQSK